MPRQSLPAPEDLSGLVQRLRQAGCVFAEDEARLLVETAATPGELERLVARRVAGEPLEQVVGFTEFDGRRVLVEPGVFVPRRRTELMVREAAAGCRSGAVVLDLCCGSGAVGAAIAARVGRVTLHAADVDPVETACARKNLPADALVHEGDLFAPVPRALRGRLDVLVANVPYVPSDDIAAMPPEARDHEPRASLDGGPDGLDLVRRVAGEAPHWLAPGGRVLVEVGTAQVAAAITAFESVGLAVRVVVDEEIGGTVVVARALSATGR
ncbi:MAG TPA: putative protein N(5)-glutamine methyltransferase [Nocardioidaceae bacterium]|nr:putative protein N(5)-glutamine methyltransferase [Nocardioidaceae bacterium]